MSILDTVERTIEELAVNFVLNPYLCYTEHGIHAYFYTQLYNNIPKAERYLTVNNQQVCVIQKEYPTADNFGKPQRQHWDISVIKKPSESTGTPEYDYLKLATVVEFGLNENEAHLDDDIFRVCHVKANLTEKAYLIHMYRFSEANDRFSNRDISRKSKVIRVVDVQNKLNNVKCKVPLIIYYCVHDRSTPANSGAWRIDANGYSKIEPS